MTGSGEYKRHPVRTSAAASTEVLKKRQSYLDPTLCKKKWGLKKKIKNIHEWFEQNFLPVAKHKTSFYHTPKTQLLFTTTAMKWVLLVRRQCGECVGNSLVCGGRKKVLKRLLI